MKTKNTKKIESMKNLQLDINSIKVIKGGVGHELTHTIQQGGSGELKK